jgi:hypothetical protein
VRDYILGLLDDCQDVPTYLKEHPFAYGEPAYVKAPKMMEESKQ